MQESDSKETHDGTEPDRGQYDLQGVIVQDRVRLVQDPNEGEEYQHGGDDAGRIALEADEIPDMERCAHHNEPNDVAIPEIIVIDDRA